MPRMPATSPPLATRRSIHPTRTVNGLSQPRSHRSASSSTSTHTLKLRNWTAGERKTHRWSWWLADRRAIERNIENELVQLVGTFKVIWEATVSLGFFFLPAALGLACFSVRVAGELQPTLLLFLWLSLCHNNHFGTSLGPLSLIIKV